MPCDPQTLGARPPLEPISNQPAPAPHASAAAARSPRYLEPLQDAQRTKMKPGKASDANNIVGGVKKLSSFPGKKQRPLRFKEGRCGQLSSSSDD
ncbi:hypothetical protein PVAP13_3KG241127 [Panicum virgatum]|uniref:Uncharacterized protein n=1 Tax=Panicum virgatum TaxID=38727 RepID=A0A8T0V4V0_PANVG|nr:hypothetical protein PVAP13_3KG241127 [Panicum virgatum]